MAPLFIKKFDRDVINAHELYKQLVALIEIPESEDKLEIVILGLQQIVDSISDKERVE